VRCVVHPRRRAVRPYTRRVEPILLVRNDEVETFGVAPDALDAAGVPVRIWDAVGGETPPPIDAASGVVVFGSTFNIEHADDQPFITRAAELCRAAVDSGTPLLGICFGAQLLAWALGRPVLKAPVREVGFEPIRPTVDAPADPLLSHLADGDHGFQWHMDTYDLPEGSTLLARGDAVANQAFRVGDAAWGVQFHLEIDAAELDLWLRTYQQEGDLEADWGKSPAQVRDEASRHLSGHEARGRELFRRFAGVARERRA
jgi:GMP synthase (glutamine-hydrolysing)